MAMTCDCAEGRHEVCRGAGPNYYFPQTADMGDQVCACPCHHDEPALPTRTFEGVPAELKPFH